MPRTDDEPDFARLMSDVKPIQNTKADLRPSFSARKDPKLAYRRWVASKEEESLVDGLSSEVSKLVESEEELIFAVPGVQINRIKKLRQGHIPWEQGIDLHGFSIDEARDELSRFIRDAIRLEHQCVIVVHGKAYSEGGQAAMIKSCVNDWLQQIPQVLAFTSAQPKDGGTGAVYVLLKRNKDKRS
ncbi:Smr/MutS family protein [Nitrincola alkalisediminis]|uniref:Smr/MutS family protein n=1 Tax=Nitrincola alkalisediminis TaxID=1366656 RepID=UPI001873AA4E|nr:Smr/MutS family protein [Nitrincola alkalisediminis]